MHTQTMPSYTLPHTPLSDLCGDLESLERKAPYFFKIHSPRLKESNTQVSWAAALLRSNPTQTLCPHCRAVSQKQTTARGREERKEGEDKVDKWMLNNCLPFMAFEHVICEQDRKSERQTVENTVGRKKGEMLIDRTDNIKLQGLSVNSQCSR